MKTLIAVAHPHDLARFFSVLPGADVYFVHPPHDAAELLRAADARLVAQLGGYDRVYTCSPLDPDLAHQELAAQLAEKYGTVCIPAISPPFVSATVLDESAFISKLALLNRLYDPALSGCELEPHGTESFSEARAEDIARARSLTHFDQVIEVEDTWSFVQSAYERRRFRRTVELCQKAAARRPVRKIIELGACEGLMTEALAAAFPEAELLAVEPSTTFYARLEQRVKHLPNVRLSRAFAKDVPLDADLVVAAEVLYYAIPDLPRMFDAMTAGALVTSYHGDFELELAAMLEQRSYVSAEKLVLPPAFEQLLGAADRPTPFIVRRVGCTIRLWLTSAT